MHLRLLSPPPPAKPLATWPGDETSPLERLEELDGEELRLLATGPSGRPLPEVEARLRRLDAERAELASFVSRAART